MLLKYLIGHLGDGDKGDGSGDSLVDEHLSSVQLSKDQICRWCTILLDAHYTQIILSDHGHLLVSLHESIRQQVHTNYYHTRACTRIPERVSTRVYSYRHAYQYMHTHACTHVRAYVLLFHSSVVFCHVIQYYLTTFPHL
jgi:hypothetical protein